MAFAQSGAGSIQGNVADSTGAVIPGATIHVVNQATGSIADTKPNEVGFYQVPGLFTGVYDVTISAAGMKTYKTTLHLLVDQNAVINVSMTAGAVTQQVEVTAQFVQLTTSDNGTITSTLENQRINQIPMNGRNVMNLIGESTPGLESCMQGQPGTCANGLMGQAMEYVADGVTLTNREFGGEHMGQNQMPDPDSIQEVRVETSGVGAQFATPAAAVITTKSGTNRLHGALFETARNNGIGIAKARQNPSNYAAPHYVRNEFGASAGGPIVLPYVYHGKDKSFWFFAYERYSQSSAGNENVTVPTTAMRGGDFSGLVNSAGVLQQLYDPATTASSSNCNNTGVANAACRQPFANNQIPMSRISPTAKMLLDITPHPDSLANPLV
ncbi:MAG: carboxypeptidase-like regulatory domain-containing protein, partial [Acidobacteriaceae bacterium]|nr:carboxypeptidase-like regulatory domain-containing protein [Acidobacteriaceae bacterium]